MKSPQLMGLVRAWVDAEPGSAHPIRKATFIEESLLGCAIEHSPRFIPGILLSVGMVLLAILITNWINNAWNYKGIISYILTAIILGMVVRNTVGVPAIFRPGISFSLNSVLKLGIILMGIRLSLSDMVSIGVWGMPIVVGCILTGIVVTTYFTRILNLPARLGTLIAVGSSICGSSAILATAPAIGAKDDEVAYAIANITVFGVIAMFTYPYIADFLFAGDIIQAGLFTGTAIHNTAQVAGAGLIYDQSFPTAAKTSVTDVAVIVKLVRNAMMVAVVPVMVLMYAKQVKAGEPAAKKLGFVRLIPLFVVGFVVMAALRSIGDASLAGNGYALGLWDGEAWSGLTESVKTWAGYLLATAMAGVGLGTSFKSMKDLGLKPFAVGLVSAFIVGFSSIILVILVGPLVRL